MMGLKLGACAAALALALLAGCTLDPHYERPAAPVAVAYPHGDGYESTSAAASSTSASSTGATPPLAADTAWQSFFRDERLQRLIGIALANAAEVVDAARAQRDMSQAREIAALREEQARLARDVHDVVGHSLAVILAQAESAQYLPDDDTAALVYTGTGWRDGEEGPSEKPFVGAMSSVYHRTAQGWALALYQQSPVASANDG